MSGFRVAVVAPVVGGAAVQRCRPSWRGIGPIRRLPRPRRLLRLGVLCFALELGGVLVGAATPWVASCGALIADPSPAFAQRSGGYRRPGGIGSYGSFERRPSVSSFGAYGGGDLAISRRASSEALRSYRALQAQPPAATTRRPSSGWDNGGWDTAPLRRPAPAGWAPAGWGASAYAPGYAAAAPRFGAWDAVLAWSLLNSLSRPQTVAYFQENRGDPGYADWRAEAQKKAASDPAVAEKLAELDALMAQSKARPSGARASPPDIGGSGTMFAVVFLGGAALFGLWLFRRRVPAVAGGGAIGSGGALAAGRSPRAPPASGATRFRVGMTFPVDPSPFLLAAGSTKVTPPEAGGMISVEAVGLINDAGIALHRLYLPGRSAFFMLHLGRDGAPDECRYFTLLDQLTPANREEWGFWLDAADGMIGWPQFETKDGKTYDRVWARGGGRVAPRQQIETVEDATSTVERRLQAMLYGAATGAAPPAPPVEYVLVCAVEEADGAWIEVHAGIDVNPATLTLPAVPLSG
jgi:Protein of unknown function (DUF2491)